MSKPLASQAEAGKPWVLPAPTAMRLDAVMRDAVDGLSGGLAAPVNRIVGAGGQRLRPALTLAVAALGDDGRGREREQLDRAGAVELLHCATLVHDDLIDGATLRRGVPTVNAAEGPSRAVLSGDVLIAAACLLAHRADPEAARVIAQTLADLCRGEALEEDLRFDASASESQLLEVVCLKTGSLLRAACVLGAQAAGLDRAACAAAGTFGMEFGVSLQLIDDVIDVASTAALAGKPVNADFVAGTVTVPAALAMRECPELRSLLRPGLDDLSRRRTQTLLRSPTALRATVAAAVHHADKAGAALLEAGGGDPTFAGLAGWPRRFIDAQLAAKVVPPDGGLWSDEG